MSTKSTLDKIMDRIEDGCYTAEQIAHCSECGQNIFDLTPEQIADAMKELVRQGRAEFRDQGKATDSPGPSIQLCVPKGLATFQSYRPRGG